MKKVAAILLTVVMVLALAACGGSKPEDKLIGSWKLTDAKAGEADDSMGQAISMITAMGGSVSIEFKKDGTGKLNMSLVSQTNDADFKWKLDNAQLVMMMDGEEDNTLGYSVEDGKLTLGRDGMQLVFEKNK